MTPTTTLPSTVITAAASADDVSLWLQDLDTKIRDALASKGLSEAESAPARAAAESSVRQSVAAPLAGLSLDDQFDPRAQAAVYLSSLIGHLSDAPQAATLNELAVAAFSTILSDLPIEAAPAIVGASLRGLEAHAPRAAGLNAEALEAIGGAAASLVKASGNYAALSPSELSLAIGSESGASEAALNLVSFVVGVAASWPEQQLLALASAAFDAYIAQSGAGRAGRGDQLIAATTLRAGATSLSTKLQSTLVELQSYSPAIQAVTANSTLEFGAAIDVELYTVNASVAAVTVNPALPSGLVLANKRLVGTARDVMARTTFTLTAASSSGATSSTTFDLEVTPHDPKTAGTLRYWFDADDISTLARDRAGTLSMVDGGRVGRWADKAGLNDLKMINVFNTEAKKPVYKTNAINGKPAVEFAIQSDGTAQSLCLSADGSTCAPIFGASRTIFAVFQVDKNANYWQGIYSTRDGGACCGTFTSLQTVGPGVADADMVMQVQGSGDALVIYPRNERVVQKPLISHHVSSPTAQSHLLLGAQINHWLPLSGRIAELLFFEGNLLPADAARVVRYLSAKYDVPLEYDARYDVPSSPAKGGSLVDTDDRAGYVAGNLRVKIGDETTLTSYRLYWADGNGAKLQSTAFATLAATGSDLTLSLPATALPAGTRQVLAVSANATNEMATGRLIPFHDRGPGLQMWLAAGEQVFSDGAGTLPAGAGDAVALWKDLSGEGFDVTPFRSGQKPTFRAAGLDGQPAVEFTDPASNGSGTGLMTAANIELDAQGLTIYVVAMNAVAPAGWSAPLGNGVCGGQAGAVILDGEPTVFQPTAYSVAGLDALALKRPLAPAVGAPFLIGSYFPVAPTNTNPLAIGSLYGGWCSYIGFISEVLVYRGEASAEQRARIADYLTAKYHIN